MNWRSTPKGFPANAPASIGKPVAAVVKFGQVGRTGSSGAQQRAPSLEQLDLRPNPECKPRAMNWRSTPNRVFCQTAFSTVSIGNELAVCLKMNMLSKHSHAVPTSAVATDPEQSPGAPSQTGCLPAPMHGIGKPVAAMVALRQVVQTGSRGAQHRAVSSDFEAEQCIGGLPRNFPCQWPCILCCVD